MTHRSSFLPPGGLSLRLAQAVAAAQGGEIHSVGNVDVCREVSEVSAAIRRCMSGMSPPERALFQLSLGLYCLAVATKVLPLWGAIAEPGANGARVERSEAADAARSRLSPHGNHGDNNCQGSLPL